MITTCMITVNIPQEIAQRLSWKDCKKMEGDPDQIVAIEHPTLPCEDCQKPVQDRRIEIKGSLDKMHYPHFAWYCTNCKLWKNPQTQRYEFEDRRHASSFFRR